MKRQYAKSVNFFLFHAVFLLHFTNPICSAFLVRLLCKIRAAKWKQQFSAKFPHYQKQFLKAPQDNKFFSSPQFFKNTFSNKVVNQHVL